MIEALELIKQLIEDGAPETEAIKVAQERYELTYGQVRALKSYLEPWA